MDNELSILEKAVEESTGKSAEELRRTPFNQQPAYKHWLKLKAQSLRYSFIYIAGNNYFKKLYYNF